MIIYKIDFNKLAHKNTQVLGFSTYDFVEEYCKLKEMHAWKSVSRNYP